MTAKGLAIIVVVVVVCRESYSEGVAIVAAVVRFVHYVDGLAMIMLALISARMPNPRTE